MSLSNYQHYKETQVDWLGKIPAHWTVQRLKWLIDRNDGGVWGGDPDGVDDTVVLRSTEQSADGFWQITEPALRKLTANERNSALLERGDLLITKSSGSSLHIGKTTLVDDEVAALTCCYSNFMQRVRMRDSFLPKLAWYIMNSALARLQFDVLSNSTTGLANLNSSVIGEVVVAVAPVAEQASIIGFLDRETRKIDALIGEQEKLLELLAEKRQAIISHAVTRGLNTDVPLKDSGAEWLGMVPEHWSAVPLKHLCTLLKDGTHLPPPRVDIGVPLLSVRNIEDSVFSTREDDSMISTDDYDVLCRTFVPAAGDVLMAIVGATLGKVAIIPTDLGNFHIQRSLAIFRPDESLLAKWLFYCISSGAFQRMLWENVGFSAQPGIYLGTLKEFKIPLPSLPEQAEVCSFLDGEVEKLNALKAEASHAIELLNERRSALIFAAVTGKIDVRERSSAMAAAA